VARKSRPLGGEHLSPGFDRHLNQYALMAVVAGVGLASLSVPADAEIIYSPAYKTAKGTQFGTSIPIDFNHDGVEDLQIVTRTATLTAFSPPPAEIIFHYGFLSAFTQAKTEILLKNGQVAAVPPGKSIGPGQPFGTGGWKMAYCIQGVNGFTGSTIVSSSSGSWNKVNSGYVGFLFFIQGQAHYGWARFNTLDLLPLCENTGVALTGYAYETEPNKSIVAGATSETDNVAADSANLGADVANTNPNVPPEPVAPNRPRRRSLGHLAAGITQ
jgi:hypothetical protein